MTRGEFLQAFEDQLEIPAGSLNGSQALAEVEGWDSMAAVLFIALADEKLGISVTGSQIAEARTIDGLLSLLGDELTV